LCYFCSKAYFGEFDRWIDLDTSIYKKEELQLDSLIFRSSLLKNVKIEDLKNSDYRQEFFLYLKNVETFIKLLSIRIKQNKDKGTFLNQEIFFLIISIISLIGFIQKDLESFYRYNYKI